MPSDLSSYQAAFLRDLPELLSFKDGMLVGKHAVYVDAKLAGIYDTSQNAYAKSVKAHGNVKMFISEILPEGSQAEVHYMSPMPA